MTAAAMEGKLDPVVGREKEMKELPRFSAAERKIIRFSSVIRCREKSAIVEGLALRIVQKKNLECA